MREEPWKEGFLSMPCPARKPYGVSSVKAVWCRNPFMMPQESDKLIGLMAGGDDYPASSFAALSEAFIFRRQMRLKTIPAVRDRNNVTAPVKMMP